MRKNDAPNNDNTASSETPVIKPTLKAGEKIEELTSIITLYMSGKNDDAKKRYAEYLRINDRKFRAFLGKKLMSFKPGMDVEKMIKDASEEWINALLAPTSPVDNSI